MAKTEQLDIPDEQAKPILAAALEIAKAKGSSAKVKKLRAAFEAAGIVVDE